MKFHLSFDGENSVCGMQTNKPDTFLYDERGFSSHYSKESQCKKCKKMLAAIQDKSFPDRLHFQK